MCINARESSLASGAGSQATALGETQRTEFLVFTQMALTALTLSLPYCLRQSYSKVRDSVIRCENVTCAQ